MRVLEAFGEPIADGGQESFVFGVIDKIDMTDLQIDCLTAYDCRSEKYRSLVEKQGGEVYTLDLPFTPGKSRQNIRKPFREFLKSHHYDIVHIHSGSISVLAIMSEVADKAGVKKVIVHSHATGFSDSLKHRAIRYVGSIFMRKHVDYYLACSIKAAQWKFEPEFVNQALIVRNGVDIEKFVFNQEKRMEWRNNLRFAPDHYVIGHVGRFTREKNHAFIIQLFEKLHSKSENAMLLLVGDGELKSEIEELAQKKDLTDWIVFAGSVSNVSDYLQAMDAFILPSLYEGLPVSAIEAQAAGLPIVVSETVTKEIDVTGNVCFLPIKDIDAWVDELYRRTFSRTANRNNTDTISKIKKSGFSIEQAANELRQIYCKTIQGK